MVGVTGEWGSGKSSILNLLDDEIRARFPNAFVVRFDPWIVSGRDDLIVEFLREITITIAADADRKSEAAREAVAELADYARILAPVPLVGGIGGAIANLFRRRESISVIRDKVAKKLARIGRPLVVLVDEVDRIEDAEIRAVAQFVRSVADFRGISYVLAYDSERVIEALGGGDRGARYLEKIVQLPISLPILFVEERERLRSSELGALADAGLPDNLERVPRYKSLTERLVANVITTPRDIKRLVGMFHVSRGMIRDEVDWVDLLGFVTLSSKFPKTLELIRDNAERYVDNPLLKSEVERRVQRRDAAGDLRFDGMIDGDEDGVELRWLIDRLFPAVGKSRVGREEFVDPISSRRSLLTVLRLGLVPGAARRETVRSLLSSNAQGVVRILRKQGQGMSLLR